MANSRYRLLSQSKDWWIGAAAACLGLLLLVVTLSLVVQNGRAIRTADRHEVCPMQCENLVYNLTKDKDALRDERDQWRVHSRNVTKAMEALQSQYNTVSAIRDKLEEDVRMLNGSGSGQLCLPGWVPFKNKCFFPSQKGVTKTWADSRKDCQRRNADLVIITTKEDQDFLSQLCGKRWIGLSDTVEEGRWKWVNGTYLGGAGFWNSGEPNDDRSREDCAEISATSGKWNDVPCSDKMGWICS